MSFYEQGREQMFSRGELSREPCARCRKFLAFEQWKTKICSLGKPDLWIPICLNCDVELNRVMLEYWAFDDWQERAAAYRAQLVARHGDPQRIVHSDEKEAA